MTPTWLYWAKVAQAHADLAERAVTPEAVVDAFSASLAGMQAEAPNPPQGRDSEEMLAAMVSVAAAAHALDGLYGSVKPLPSLPPSRARRPRRITEALKAGSASGSRPRAGRLRSTGCSARATPPCTPPSCSAGSSSAE